MSTFSQCAFSRVAITDEQTEMLDDFVVELKRKKQDRLETADRVQKPFALTRYHNAKMKATWHDPTYSKWSPIWRFMLMVPLPLSPIVDLISLGTLVGPAAACAVGSLMKWRAKKSLQTDGVKNTRKLFKALKENRSSNHVDILRFATKFKRLSGQQMNNDEAVEKLWELLALKQAAGLQRNTDGEFMENYKKATGYHHPDSYMYLSSEKYIDMPTYLLNPMRQLALQNFRQNNPPQPVPVPVVPPVVAQQVNPGPNLGNVVFPPAVPPPAPMQFNVPLNVPAANGLPAHHIIHRR